MGSVSCFHCVFIPSQSLLESTVGGPPSMVSLYGVHSFDCCRQGYQTPIIGRSYAGSPISRRRGLHSRCTGWSASARPSTRKQVGFRLTPSSSVRAFIHLPLLHLSVHPSICLPFSCPCVHLSDSSLSVSASVYLPLLHLSVHQSICLPFSCPSVKLSDSS